MLRFILLAGVVLAIAVALDARETLVRRGTPPSRLAQPAASGVSRAQPAIPPATDATPEAITDAERAVARSPGDTAAQLRLGGLLYRVRRFPEAIAAYEKVLGIDPSSAQAYLGIGLCRGKNDESEPAEAAFRRAIEIDPKMAAAYNGLGVVLLRRGDRDAARVEFDRALELDPSLAVARSNLEVLAEPPPEATAP